MDSSDSIGVYGEAKAEYTRQLCIFVVPALETYFLDLLTEVKTTEKDSKRVLWVFQDSLKMFPDWNVDKVQRETEKVSALTKCDYLEEILTAVFIAHTKVLSAIRLTSKQKKLQITIPKLEHFLHRTMSECARLLWSNAYLFAENVTSVDRQKNLRQVEQLLHEAVLQSIRGMLPVKSILKEYLTDDGDEDEAPVAQEEVVVPPEPVVETAPVPVVETPEPVVEAPAPVPVIDDTKAISITKVDLSENTVPTTPIQTIVIDTEPAVVGFTQMDTVFDSQDPEQNMIRSNTHEESEQSEAVDSIIIRDDIPPEDLTEFEDLEQQDARLAEDEFETL